MSRARLTEKLSRRPLFVGALFLSAGLVLAQQTPPPPWAAATAFVVCVMGAFYFLVRQNQKVSAWFAIAALVPLGVILLANGAKLSRDHVAWRAAVGGDEVALGGKIVSEVAERRTLYGASRISFTLESSRFWQGSGSSERGTDRVHGKVRVYLNSAPERPRYGDEIVVKGKLALPEGRRNPGGFDARAWLRLDNVHAVFYGGKASPRILRREKGNPVIAAAIRLKKRLSWSLGTAFNTRDAAFLQALFLGERSGLEEDFKDLFVRTGTLHILSVSGFNIGFLMVSLLFLLKPFPLTRDAKLSILLAAVWAYCLLVGWQAPVVRASFMATLFLMAQILGRKADGLNTLGFAALAILLWRPVEIFDVGFQLSFIAVGGIILFQPSFAPAPLPAGGNPRLAAPPSLGVRARRYASELFWVSFVCLFTTLPLTSWNFYLVTPFSVLANMAVVPLSFLLFFTGIFFFLSTWLPQALFIPVVMKHLMEAFTAALYFFESLPGAAVIVGRPILPLVVVLSAGTVWLLYDKRFKSRLARAACVALLALDVFLAQEALRHFRPPLMTLTALDVGQGEALYMEFPGGGNLLVDAGKGQDADRGRRVVAPFLKAKGVRSIDAVLMSHSDEDHAGGLAAVLDEFGVKRFLSGPDDGSRLYALLEEDAKKRGIPHGTLKARDRLEGFRDTTVEVLNPSAEYPAFLKNDNSLVLRAAYGKTAFLLTGDIGPGAMDRLVKSRPTLAADVLVVPHHGAKMGQEGEAFVRAASPRYAPISVGKTNSYGHPAPATLSALRASGAEILRTDTQGALSFTSDGTTVEAKKFLKNS